MVACRGGPAGREATPLRPASEASTPAGAAERCLDGVCIGEEAARAGADRLERLERCVPVEEDYRGDASALGLGGVARVEGEDGGTVLILTLVNHSSRGVWTYPGTSLEVLVGDALLSAPGSSPASSASHTLFGIEACSADEHRYPVTFGTGSTLTLAASAFHELGDAVTDRFTITVSR